MNRPGIRRPIPYFLELYWYICLRLSIFCSEIAKHLSLPPVKLHCSMLAEDAIKAAVKDYEAKKGKLAKTEEQDIPSP